MVIQNDEIKMIHLSEIDTVIFESIAISISGVLLVELSKRKICIIYCDERHLPYAQQMPFSSNYLSSARITKQIKWQDSEKDRTWALVVSCKIEKQSLLLKRKGFFEESEMLLSYLPDVVDGDKTNREGFAAKVYFNAIFGSDFTRKGSETELNACLDYGYSVLLAMTAREIVKNGYIPGLGIHHIGVYNPYNLACDIMEPFRPIVDEITLENFTGFLDSEFKQEMWNLGNKEVYLGKERAFLPVAINDFFRSTCKCLEEDSHYLPCYTIK